MATYKVTYIFNWGRMGWSESWYANSVDMPGLQSRADTVALRRAEMMGTGAKLEAIRLSDEAIRGDSIVNFDPVPGVIPAGDADYVTNALLLRVESGTMYRRLFHVRGVPDDWIELVTETKLLAANSARTDAVNAFISALVDAQFRLKVISKEPPNNVGIPITTISSDADGWVKLLAAGVNASTTDPLRREVRVRGFEGPDKDQLNGVWKVRAVDATSVTIPVRHDQLGSPTENIHGEVWNRVITYELITAGGHERASSRQTGSAFFIPAGRRRARQ